MTGYQCSGITLLHITFHMGSRDFLFFSSKLGPSWRDIVSFIVPLFRTFQTEIKRQCCVVSRLLLACIWPSLFQRRKQQEDGRWKLD